MAGTDSYGGSPVNSRSTYVSPGLGDPQLVGNVISSDKAELRIIGRTPERGLPKDGVPFSLDIEIETFRNWATVIFMPIFARWGACPDAIVVVRSADTGRVWAAQRMNGDGDFGIGSWLKRHQTTILTGLAIYGGYRLLRR